MIWKRYIYILYIYWLYGRCLVFLRFKLSNLTPPFQWFRLNFRVILKKVLWRGDGTIEVDSPPKPLRWTESPWSWKVLHVGNYHLQEGSQWRVAWQRVNFGCVKKKRKFLSHVVETPQECCRSHNDFTTSLQGAIVELNWIHRVWIICGSMQHAFECILNVCIDAYFLLEIWVPASFLLYIYPINIDVNLCIYIYISNDYQNISQLCAVTVLQIGVTSSSIVTSIITHWDCMTVRFHTFDVRNPNGAWSLPPAAIYSPVSHAYMPRLEDETSWKEGDRMMKRFAQWLMVTRLNLLLGRFDWEDWEKWAPWKSRGYSVDIVNFECKISESLPEDPPVTVGGQFCFGLLFSISFVCIFERFWMSIRQLFGNSSFG